MAEKNWPQPGFPLVQGEHALTDTWSIHLPEPFARRIEDGSLVLWRPGLTVWMTAWGGNREELQAERLASIKTRASPDRFAEREFVGGGVTRFSYRLREQGDDGLVESLNAFAFNDGGHLQMSVYFDDPSDEARARQLVDSVTVRPEAESRSPTGEDALAGNEPVASPGDRGTAPRDRVTAAPPKNFKLRADQIKPLATGYGGCIATDMITVTGMKVGFMYRQAPHNDLDSGWCFTAGVETQQYMDDAANHAIYDVNTIANYDPDIIPLLDAPVGAAFERNRSSGELVPVRFKPED